MNPVKSREEMEMERKKRRRTKRSLGNKKRDAALRRLYNDMMRLVDYQT